MSTETPRKSRKTKPIEATKPEENKDVETNKTPKESPKSPKIPKTKNGKKASKTKKARSKSVGKEPAKPKKTKEETKEKTDKPEKQPKKPKVYKERPLTSIDICGLAISAAKVNSILTKMAFNPNENKTCHMLLDAQGKIKAKPTEENPDPKPVKKYSTIADLGEPYVSIINEVENMYTASIKNEYIKSKVAAMSEKEHTKYAAAKSAAKKAAEDAKRIEEAKTPAERNIVPFDIHSFNEHYDPKFYDGFKKFYTENDKYAVGKPKKKAEKKDKKPDEKPELYTVFSRAHILVKKFNIRISPVVKVILACFLDGILVQFAKHGIVSCINQENKNIKIKNLFGSESTDDLPLLPIIKTLNIYNLCMKYLADEKAVDEENKAIRAKNKSSETREEVKPRPKFDEYKTPEYIESFMSYPQHVFNSVLRQMINSKEFTEKAFGKNFTEKEFEEKREILKHIKCSKDFKIFGHCAVAETALRIGSYLKARVVKSGVKTINGKIVREAIEGICQAFGIDKTDIMTEVDTKYNKFITFREAKKKAEEAKNEQAKKTAEAKADKAGDVYDEDK